mgnify:CR=1 FL=1
MPAQVLALITWLEHQTDLAQSSVDQTLKLLQYKYLPHSFLTNFVSPCLHQLTKSTLPNFLPNMTVKPFTYFVKTDSPEEQATEKYTGVRTCFYTQVSSIQLHLLKSNHVKSFSAYIYDSYGTCVCVGMCWIL